mgnify:CR=1 FL=1
MEVLLSIIILAFLVVASLKKFTNEQIFKRAGAFCIGGSSVSLLLAIYNLIKSAIDAPGVKEFFAATTSLQINLLFSIVKLATGISIYKSGRSVSVLSSIVVCFVGLLSAIDCIVNPSFVSNFTFMFMFLPIMAMLRQFRDKRRRSK